MVGKSVAILVTDGGPDWNQKSLANIINFGRLWRAQQLDALILVRYAPGQSRFNMVERRWGSLTCRLSQVVFPLNLPGEKETVFKQHIPEDERRQKIRTVFDNAVKGCCQRWRGDTYDGHGIVLYPVLSPKNNEKDSADAEHEKLIKEMKIKSKKKFQEAHKELKFYLKHFTRSLYKMEFTKCGDVNCDCMRLPIRAKKYFSFLDSHAGLIPTPVPCLSPFDRKNHFRTLLEILHAPNSTSSLELDRFAPGGSPQFCEKGCRYIFFSGVDKDRHDALMHS